MTNEEREDAIKFFNEIAKKEVNNAKYSKLAIEALEQKTCEDCISRQEVINCVTSNEFRYKIVEDIKTLPSVTPREKTGHWVNAKVGKLFPSNDYKCSECGNLLDFDGVNCGRGDANYCPNCGCHMVEPHESEG